MKKKTTHKKQELKVVLDTSVIYTGSESDLFKKNITEFIDKHSKSEHIKIDWFLPETVKEERRFQMHKKGLELLPSIQKLEKLLGHNLLITEKIIKENVDITITKNIASWNIQEIKLDHKKVDWNALIHKSLHRHPPFEDNKKEKGFRDALILESLIQLIDSSTKSKIVFIADDNILREAASKIAAEKYSNLKPLPNIEELDSFIDFLKSTAQKKLINSIINAASSLFYTKNDNNCFYIKEDLHKKVTEKFAQEFEYRPHDCDKRVLDSIIIPTPTFIKQKGKQVHWKSILTFESTAYRKKLIPVTGYGINVPHNNNNQSTFNSLSPLYSLEKPSALSWAAGTDYGSPSLYSHGNLGNFSGLTALPEYKEEVSAKGKIKIEVTWAVTLSASKKILNPILEGISFIEQTWEY